MENQESAETRIAEALATVVKTTWEDHQDKLDERLENNLKDSWMSIKKDLVSLNTRLENVHHVTETWITKDRARIIARHKKSSTEIWKMRVGIVMLLVGIFGLGMLTGAKHTLQWLRQDETKRILAKDELAIGQMVLTKWSAATKEEQDLINKLLSHPTLNKAELKKTKKGLDQMNATYNVKNQP